MNKQEKVVIPKFVAEWIERCKENNDTLYHALQDNDDVIDWLDRDDNEDLFARAWVNGYEAEKEKLYYVNIPNVYHGDLGYHGSFGEYSFYNKEELKKESVVRFKLTEEEIKKNNEELWQFAKPVEEE